MCDLEMKYTYPKIPFYVEVQIVLKCFDLKLKFETLLAKDIEPSFINLVLCLYRLNF